MQTPLAGHIAHHHVNGRGVRHIRHVGSEHREFCGKDKPRITSLTAISNAVQAIGVLRARAVHNHDIALSQRQRGELIEPDNFTANGGNAVSPGNRIAHPAHELLPVKRKRRAVRDNENVHFSDLF
ncbi:hypothetical protein [Bifidobacterium pseudolongum]|uniref:hypothetical protein n=1 Tax=Bifidobacterium pseudolongum TaxID=1694 RepID=UPI001C3D5867|nr:hypothetical protein [Bifidobacterium pseudolongum]MCI8753277.1 hypothetical protein [Bifidobacterium pseudolongum]